MDYSAIATTAIAAVSPYLVKGGEEIAKGVGKDLWELIKKPFKAANDETIVKQLEEKPDDQKLLGKVEGKLEELLKTSPDIAQELQQKIDEANKPEEKTRITTVVNSKNVAVGTTISAGGNVTFGDTSTSSK